MSHEIRTPMNGVLGMLELLSYGSLDTDQKEMLRLAKLSAENLLVVINDILDFSKLEANRLHLEAEVVNWPTLVEELLRMMRVSNRNAELCIDHQAAANISPWFITDSTRLRQILINLLGNAVKFTKQGHVCLHVNLDYTQIPGDLHFCVEDTGIGIAQDQLNQIFEAFTQGDSSISRRFGGTGLGLAITARLVRLLGGRIWVESTLGSGSRFHFVLPQLAMPDRIHTLAPQPKPC
jgi:signal transduction histidine kinase